MVNIQKYDLRYRDLLWSIRDSIPGAAMTDSQDVNQMKRRMTRNLFVSVGIIIAVSMALPMIL